MRDVSYVSVVIKLDNNHCYPFCCTSVNLGFDIAHDFATC